MSFKLPEQAPAQERFAQTPNARLWYSDTGGDGQPIVLCHPASQSAQIWAYQQPVLAAAGNRVIAYSRRGYGHSEKGAPDELGTSVGDLYALLDHLEIGKAHILGAAAGGIVALAFAVAHPDRTLTVTLAGTIFSPNEPEWREAYGHLGIVSVRDAVSTEFLELGPTYRFTNPEGTACFADFSNKAHSNAPVRQPSGVEVTWAALAKMSRPTLLLTGEADLYAPPPLQNMIACHLPDVEIHTFPEVGHAAYWEQPEAFNKMILRFLTKHSA